jgi:glutamate dehydrogenase
MAVKPEEIEAELVGRVCECVRSDAPSAERERAEEFVRRYYHWVPHEELAAREPRELCGAALAQLRLARTRTAGAAKIRVYNPERERDGWSSPHTVVEIVCDDAPFLVDSVGMELSRRLYRLHLLIHPVIWVGRDAGGELVVVERPGADGAVAESVMHAEVDRESDPERRAELARALERVIEDVGAAVRDWAAMRERARAAAGELDRRPSPVGAGEARAFLEWLEDDNYIFLGYREYELLRDGGDYELRGVTGSGLGILRGETAGAPSGSFARLRPPLRASAQAPDPLILTKADSRSTVHRPRNLDYVGVKRFDDRGRVVGERRFLGLYTSTAEKASPRSIPVLRGKVEGVVRRAGFPPGSHDAKALADILETYPRDELLEIDEDTLFDIAMGILALGERQRVRLFVRRDRYERFVSCLVYIPRDRYNTSNRERIAALLGQAFAATSLDWSLLLSDSRLVRLHYIVHLGPDSPHRYDVAAIETRLADATRSWVDDLAAALRRTSGEEQGTRLLRRYADAFPAGYRDDWSAERAVADIGRIERAAADGGIDLTVYRSEQRGQLRCKLFSPGAAVVLSNVVPIFENMGARVTDERPYEVTPAGGDAIWVYDFGLSGDFAVGDAVGAFTDAFVGVWNGDFENDRLGALVVAARLNARQVSLLRTIVKYRRQAGIGFSDRYLQQALTRHPPIARMLVELFAARFDPERRDAAAAERTVAELERAIDAVESLDEDRLLRDYLAIVQAVTRTNYFQPARPSLSLKLDPERLAFLPEPRPRFEIYVYSPRVEGVHLRGGKVARGGIRWSDRREDFRFEVLGLMKAQTVKNATIVPVGAKGGFIVKRPPPGREALTAEAERCYRTFIGGLLDVTDNIAGGEVVPPPHVVRYDGDDPYLVVAADKGTAALSDVANEIAVERGFWLGDAFASGGSHGYDHKRMGITARGAWEAVKRHFRELGVDPHATDFTVVGIGDMSGDVFGNGMLLSPHIKLIGAFNHEHVLLDPDPDPARSLDERRRLFALARSRWSDYDAALISPGGGVFSRAAKRIDLSPEARRALDVDDESLTPNELIRALLRAPVDLLWNGGIGTYVKASAEAHADVGDKANDPLRVDAADLRCRVVAEGGNLGLTQRGRIEYALRGGLVNTDSIDNVGGVNCSDQEVNLKVLLDAAVAGGKLAVGERNRLLDELTGTVADRVLRQSYSQTLALSLAKARAPRRVDLHAMLIRRLAERGGLDRELEFLPSEEEIAARKRAGDGLTAPELSIVHAYAKLAIKGDLVESDIAADPNLADEIAASYPPPLPDRFREEMQSHRLRREIIATYLANGMVDRIGSTFVLRMAAEGGAATADIARAYAAAVAAFEMRDFWAQVNDLDNRVDFRTQYEMLFEGRRLIGRVTRWLVADPRRPIDIAATAARLASAAQTVARALPDILPPPEQDAWRARVDGLSSASVPRELAVRVADLDPLFSALDVADVAAATGRPLADVATAYLDTAGELDLHWLAGRILELPRADRFQMLARAALRDELYRLHRSLAGEVLAAGGVERWLERTAAEVESCGSILREIRAADEYDVTTLSVALREIRNVSERGAGPRTG